MVAAKPFLDNEFAGGRFTVNKIGVSDLKDALARGLEDFHAMPIHSIFVVFIYPVIGLILIRLSFGYDMLPVVFPLLAGFTLLGPFTAIGLYEMSRRREQGQANALEALGVFSLPRIWPIAVLGVVLTVVFLAWLTAAMAIYQATLGDWSPASPGEFVSRVLFTPEGRTLILAGWGAGFLFALFTFAISVVSFPLLVDRDVGAATAVAISIQAVAANPGVMAAWGLIVAGALVAGSLPVLVGLAVVMPVLGHATWHLYRKLVPPPSPRTMGAVRPGEAARRR